MTQLPFFGGGTLSEDAGSVERLTRLLDRVERYMSDGRWRTLADISAYCRGTEASVSARLRDLRKMGYVVDRRRVGPGLFEYRVH